MADAGKRTISGPGAADFLTAPGGLDTPESGGKGMSQLRDEALTDDPRRFTPQTAPADDVAEDAAVRGAGDDRPGSQTGTVGGGGASAHNPSPNRAIGQDDPSVKPGP